MHCLSHKRNSQIATHVGSVQVASADLVLLNKCDTVSAEELPKVEEALSHLTTAKVDFLDPRP